MRKVCQGSLPSHWRFFIDIAPFYVLENPRMPFPAASRPSAPIVALVALALWGLLSGCESTANRDMKRAQDRAAIQLSYAQRDRDEYKAQVDKLQAALADSQAKHTLEQQQVAALRADLQRAQDASLEAQKSQAEANR